MFTKGRCFCDCSLNQIKYCFERVVISGLLVHIPPYPKCCCEPHGRHWYLEDLAVAAAQPLQTPHMWCSRVGLGTSFIARFCHVRPEHSTVFTLWALGLVHCVALSGVWRLWVSESSRCKCSGERHAQSRSGVMCVLVPCHSRLRVISLLVHVHLLKLKCCVPVPSSEVV